MPRRTPSQPPHTDTERIAPRRGGARRNGAGTAAKAAAARRKRMHPIEAARMFHALEDPPRKTQADIARETGRSPAYISILCRVGDAIRELTSEQRDALRRPHVTYTALATLVSRHKRRDSLLAAIQALATRTPQRRTRAMVGGASLWTRPEPVDPAEAPLDPLPPPRTASVRASENVFTYVLDPAAWRANPDVALEEFEAHLRSLLDGVMRGAKRALGAAGGPISLASTQPRRTPPQSLRDHAETLAALDLSLRQLEARVDATRRGHRAQLTAFEAEREARRADRFRGGAIPAGRELAGTPVSAEEIESDLAD